VFEMSDNHRRAMLALRAKRLEIAREIADDTGWDRDRVEILLRQARWDPVLTKAKIERCSADFTVAEADMVGSYADRRQQAIAFLMDALACDRTEATKLLSGAGGRVERVIAQLIRKHTALKKRRLKYADEDAALAAARSATSGTDPVTDDPIDIDPELVVAISKPVDTVDEPVDCEDWPADVIQEQACGVDTCDTGCAAETHPPVELGEISDATIVCGAAGSSSFNCESPDEEEDDVMLAAQAADANEIECLAKVFELEAATAKKYYEEAVPARNGTCFEAAANAVIAEFVAEIMDFVDKKAKRKLHKMKQVVIKRMSNWSSCRSFYFAYVPGRDRDPVGEAFASCFELVNQRELLPCDKKGCCVVNLPSMQLPSSATSIACNVIEPALERVAPAVHSSGGKAKMVYTGKAKI